jgi:6-pyruvoyltetrahydropterin/6-carboxytetrahydropterin synthase
VLEVSLRGEIDPHTGYVMDLADLSKVLHESVLNDVDHRNLNTDVDWLAGRVPTTEVLADAIWDRLDPLLPAGVLWRVVVRETEKNRAERIREASA